MRSVNRIYLNLFAVVGQIFIYFTFLEVELKKEFVSTIESTMEVEMEQDNAPQDDGIFSCYEFIKSREAGLNQNPIQYVYISDKPGIDSILDVQIKWQNYSDLSPPKFGTISYL